MAQKEIHKHVLTGGVRKPIRWRPSVIVVHESWKYQKSIEILIHKLSFVKLIQVIAVNIMANVYFATSGIWAVPQVTAYLTGLD